jgi:hypothetical protein
MKGFKPTGYGPSAGFKFPSSFGFTGSTGAYTNVQPYVRRKAFADGGFVRQDNPRMKEDSIGDQGNSMARRAKSYCNVDQESGGKSPLRPGYKKGGMAKKPKGKKPNPMMKANMKQMGEFPSKPMKKANGGLTSMRGAGAMSDREMKMMSRKAGMGAMTDREKMMMDKKAKPAVGIKSKFYADGGKAEYPKPSYMEAVKDRVKSMLGVGEDSSGLAKRAADKLERRGRQIDAMEDAAVNGKTSASNYSRGGKAMKRGKMTRC